MSTAVATPQEQQEAPKFDAAAYIDRRNKGEAAPATTAVEPAKITEKQDEPHLPRSVRRQLQKLADEAAELRGQLKAYQELGVTGKKEEKQVETKTETSGKPDRKTFKDGPDGDAEYAEAIATYAANEANERRDQAEQLKQRILDMGAKAAEDFKTIPDWDKHAKEAEENGTEIDWRQQTVLARLLGTSEWQAHALDYFAQHDEELVALTKMKPEEQIAEFKGLESHLRRVYSKSRKAETATEKKPEEKKEPEKVKTLPAPSESVSVKGGSAPSTKVEPMLNGKANPAWLAQRNERATSRR